MTAPRSDVTLDVARVLDEHFPDATSGRRCAALAELLRLIELREAVAS